MVKKRASWLVPAGLTLAIVLAAYAIAGLYPFGDRTVLVRDLYQQYAPMLYAFYDTVTGAVDFLYNAAIQGGVSNLAAIGGELVNPLNYLLLLGSRAQIYQQVNLLVLAYLTIAAAGASLFFRRVFPGLHRALNPALSVLYALSGYALYMYQILPWLAVMAAFPFLMLAGMRMVRIGKGARYAALLGWTVAVSFQLGYMTVLFALFAGGIYLFRQEKPDRARIAWRIGGYTVAGLLLSGVVFAPYAAALLSSMRSVLDPGSTRLIGNLGLADLFDKVFLLFNPICFAALATWLFSKKRRAPGERRAYWPLLCALFLMTIFIDPWHKAWLLGSYARFPVRFGYMVVFSGLCALAGALRNRPDAPEKRAGLWSGATAMLCVLAFAGVLWQRERIARGFETLEILRKAFPAAVCVAALLAVLSAAGVIAYTRNSARLRAALTLMVAATYAVTVCLMCLYPYFDLTALKTTLAIRETGASEDILNRVSGLDRRTEKSAALVAHAGTVGGYLPFGATLSYYQAASYLGYEQQWVSLSSQGGTLLSDALMHVGYRLSPAGDQMCAALGEPVLERNGHTLWAVDSLPLGVTIDSAFQAGSGDFFDEQNALYRALGGEGELFVRTRGVTDAEGACTFRWEAAGACVGYLLIDAKPEACAVAVNGAPFSSWRAASQAGRPVEVGYFDAGEQIGISIARKDGRPVSAGDVEVGWMDVEKYCSLLKKWEDVQAFTRNGRVLSGAVYCPEPGRLLVFPLDGSGWRAEVNKEAVACTRALGGLLAVPLSAGENEVVLRYFPDGLKLGLCMTVLGAACLVVLWLLRRRGEPGWLHQTALWLYGVALAAGVALLYVLPIVQFVRKFLL